MEIHLATPEGFSYTPGQFIQVVIPGTDNKLTRSYSLASIPSDKDLELCIKITPGGTTDTYFQHLKPGDEVIVRGPFGQFVHKENESVAYVATGSGLAPIMGLIRHDLYTKKQIAPIHVWFGVRSEKDIFWLERLETMARDFPHFTYTLTLSQPTPTWSGDIGRVTEYVTKNTTSYQAWFICGNAQMVKDVRHILKEKSVPEALIHQEIF
jgi:NAD(P)H-flavin reductase